MTAPHADRDRTEPPRETSHELEQPVNSETQDVSSRHSAVPFEPESFIGCPKCLMQLGVDGADGTHYTLIHEADGSHTFEAKPADATEDIDLRFAVPRAIVCTICGKDWTIVVFDTQEDDHL